MVPIIQRGSWKLAVLLLTRSNWDVKILQVVCETSFMYQKVSVILIWCVACCKAEIPTFYQNFLH